MNGMLTANPQMFREMVVEYLLRAIAMLVAIPAHEMAHAWVSSRLGDDTARRHGRLTMNPMAHFDPMGALCLIFFGVGWAKPVPTDARRFRYPRRDMALTAAAGPAMNLALAWVSTVLYKLAYYLAPAWFAPVTMLLATMIQLNVALAVFNLLPVPPFDGSRMLTVFLPPKYYFGIMRYERYLMVGMMALLWLGVLSWPLAMLNSAALHLMGAATGFVELLLF